MPLVQVGWKNFYEVTYDASGAEISRRFVRREPIFEEVADSTAVIGKGLVAAVGALKRLTQRAVTDGATVSVDDGSVGPTTRAASRGRGIREALASTADAVKRLVHTEPASQEGENSSLGTENGPVASEADTQLDSVERLTSPIGETVPVGLDDLVTKFHEFCKTKANFNPPAPLAFDALRLFKEFEKSQLPPLTSEFQTALDAERSHLENEVAPYQQRLNTVKGGLQWASVRALGSFSSGLSRKRARNGGLFLADEFNVRSAAWTKLGQAKVSTDPEPISQITREKINKAARLLASRWSDKIRAENQGVFSVYQDVDAQQTIIQVAGGQAGSVFVTLPGLLDPTDVARQVLEALRGVLTDALNPSDPVVVLNGAFPEINMKEMISGRVVVRSRSEQTEPVVERIGLLYDRAPLTPENTSILSAMPESAEDLGRLRLDPTSFDLWEALPPAYAQTMADRGFAAAATARAAAPDFLRALQTKENVIVLVAHGESDCLYFPDGSEVRPADIEAIRDDISKNKPVVYLFSCEAARYAMVEAISETLLRCGAAAVVAPQETIRADQTRAFLSNFLARATGQTPIIGLRDAETDTGNYSMETWLG